MSSTPAPAAKAAPAVPKGRSAPGAAGGADRRRRPKKFGAGNRRGNDADLKDVVPKSFIGQLAKNGKIDDVRDIFCDSRQLREPWIGKILMGSDYTEEKLCHKMVQKQTRSGQSTKTKATVVIGNKSGLVGVASGRGADNQRAIKAAMNKSTKNLTCVRKGYWGEPDSSIKPHTIPNKVTGKCGSVSVKLMPAPIGTGCVCNKTHKKILDIAGIQDCFVKSKGATSTTENHVKAMLDALRKTYSFYPQQDWANNNHSRSIYDKSLIVKVNNQIA